MTSSIFLHVALFCSIFFLSFCLSVSQHPTPPPTQRAFINELMYSFIHSFVHSTGQHIRTQKNHLNHSTNFLWMNSGHANKSRLFDPSWIINTTPVAFWLPTLDQVGPDPTDQRTWGHHQHSCVLFYLYFSLKFSPILDVWASALSLSLFLSVSSVIK